jgi:hypothetical protein
MKRGQLDINPGIQVRTDWITRNNPNLVRKRIKKNLLQNKIK